VKTIKINNLKVKITGQKLTIFDPLKDVSNTEAALIANYLYNEGFFKKSNNIKIIVNYDSKK
jgi:hypothetical protein